jgi:hypothetical protein
MLAAHSKAMVYCDPTIQTSRCVLKNHSLNACPSLASQCLSIACADVLPRKNELTPIPPRRNELSFFAGEPIVSGGGRIHNLGGINLEGDVSVSILPDKASPVHREWRLMRALDEVDFVTIQLQLAGAKQFDRHQGRAKPGRGITRWRRSSAQKTRASRNGVYRIA